MSPSPARGPPSASEVISKLIASQKDWKGPTLAAVRKAVREADPAIIEEMKWMGTPTWSREGVICVATLLKNRVKVTFSRGGEIEDPDHLFNNGLQNPMWRAIDLNEGDEVRAAPLKRLVRAAVARNIALKRSK
jgi:hypothetical protein